MAVSENRVEVMKVLHSFDANLNIACTMVKETLITCFNALSCHCNSLHADNRIREASKSQLLHRSSEDPNKLKLRSSPHWTKDIMKSHNLSITV